MLSRPRKPPSKTLQSRRVLAVHPPAEVDEQLVEDPLEELGVLLAGASAVDLVDAPRRPRVHRRVHVVERPLVRGELTVRVHVPLAAEQQQLLLGEVGIDDRHREHVEREVPRGVPGVLPLVGHRDDVGVVEVRPLRVASVLATGRRRRHRGVAVEPLPHVVAVVLLRPQQAGDRPALHIAERTSAPARPRGRRRTRRLPRGASAARRRSRCRRPRPRDGRSSSRTRTLTDAPAGTSKRYQAEPSSRTAPGSRSPLPEITWSLMPSFGNGVRVLDPPQPLRVRLVLAEQKLRVVVADEPAGAERAVGGLDDVVRRRRGAAARRLSRPHDHVLRNHTVGRMWSGAASGPRLRASMRMQMSSGALFAYVSSTSK